MEGTEAEGLLRNLDRRVQRVEQFLPTLVTQEKFDATVATLVTEEKFDATVATLVTQEKFDATVATLVTQEKFDATIATLVTQEKFDATVAKLATKEELHAEVAKLATKEELRAESERCRHHIDVRIEEVHDHIQKVIDGQQAAAEHHQALLGRMAQERAHARLENRVTRLEQQAKPPGTAGVGGARGKARGKGKQPRG